MFQVLDKDDTYGSERWALRSPNGKWPVGDKTPGLEKRRSKETAPSTLAEVISM